LPDRLQVGRWDARALAAQLGAVSVQRLRRQVGTQNAHFRLAHPDDRVWFLKVYGNADHGLRERAALQALDHALRPKLLTYGEHDGRLWAALAWTELTRVRITSAEAAEQLAAAAADVHRLRFQPAALSGALALVAGLAAAADLGSTSGAPASVSGATSVAGAASASGAPASVPGVASAAGAGSASGAPASVSGVASAAGGGSTSGALAFVSGAASAAGAASRSEATSLAGLPSLAGAGSTSGPISGADEASVLGAASAAAPPSVPFLGSSELPLITDVVPSLDRALADIAPLDPPFAARIRAIFEPVRAKASAYAAAFEANAAPCLLQGDCQSRNLFRAEAGPPFLIDFERAALGPPEYDLIWVWHTELRHPHLRAAFLARYSAAIDHGREVPDPRYLWLIGLMFAAACVRYAHRVPAPACTATRTVSSPPAKRKPPSCGAESGWSRRDLRAPAGAQLRAH
jgi:hypothetical protein